MTPGIDGFTKLLLHCDGADTSQVFTDVSASAHAITAAGAAQVDTAQSVFGGGSLFTQANADYLWAADSADWAFGSGDFTIDFRTRYANIGGVACGLFDHTEDVLNYMTCGWVNAGTDYIQFSVKVAGAVVIDVRGNWTPAINTWYHVALVRSGSNWYWFVDGVDITTSGSPDASAYPDLAGQFHIGHDGTPNFHNGWMDELRISKGIARWTAPFTPPTVPYTVPPPHDALVPEQPPPWQVARRPGVPSRVFDGPAFWSEYENEPPPEQYLIVLQPPAWQVARRPGVPSATFTDATMRVKHYQEHRGLYRIFDYLPGTGVELEGWRVYHKVGSPPDQVPGDLWATSSASPFEPNIVLGDGVHYFSVSYFDGVLESGFRPIGPNGEPYLRQTVSGGVGTEEPPQAPDTWQVELRPNGVVRIVALYQKAADVAAGGAAEEWSIAYTTNGAAPATDTPDLTEAMAFQGQVAELAYDLPAQGDGTTVKVRLQTRRDDGTWTYSEASTVETATADAVGPGAPDVAAAWPGRLPEEA